MRFMAMAAAAMLLAACATAPASAPASPSAPAQQGEGASARVAQLLGAAGGANAPSQADIERALGRPDITRRDGAGAALTYRLPTCALLLVFTADRNNVMRLAQTHPSARRSGDAAPSVDQCAAEAVARR